MQLVIPMAGLGKRFADAGYTLPKPLIPVGGVPMVVRVVRDLPPATRHVFVCHPEHVARHRIDQVLKQHFPGARIVVAPGLTAGQACSVALAAPDLEPVEPVLVAACDNTHLYDAAAFDHLTADRAVDGLVWTYRGEPRVTVQPQWYGWVRAGGGGGVEAISVKQPLSDNPLRDHVVSGCFWFRTASLLLGGIDRLVARGIRVNGEFYLDSVPGVLAERGVRFCVFEVDKYIGWGTPDDLDDYHRWQQYFTRDRSAA